MAAKMFAGELLAGGGEEGDGPPKLREPNGCVFIGCELNILGALKESVRLYDLSLVIKLTSRELIWNRRDRRYR
jgi:hypothetical protein